MALALQMQEMEQANEAGRRQRRLRYMWDPVWGGIEFKLITEREAPQRRRRYRVQQMAAGLFTTCPCLMITFGCFRDELSKPLSRSEVQRAWLRLVGSFSFIFAMVQVATLAWLSIQYHIEPFNVNPMLGPQLYALDLWGAKNAAKIRYQMEWWRLFTPMFLHAGWLHLLSNLLMQLRLSIFLEVIWGRTAWLLIYILSGCYGSLTSCIFMLNTLSVGSSGALCGLIGAWVPFILATWNQTLPDDVKLRNTQLSLVISSIILLIPLSFLPMVDFAAHVGGLVMGAAVSCALFAGRLQTRAWRIAMRSTGLVLISVLVPFSAYWFVFFTTPSEALLLICPKPGCEVTAAPTSGTSSQATR